MPRRGRLEVDLIANVGQFTAGINEANRKLSDMSAAVAKLNRTFGEGSTFGRLMQMFRGAGAFAGLAIAARSLGDMAMNAANFAKEMRTGEKTISDLHLAIARGTPILRDMLRALEGGAELLSPTGTDATAQVKAFGTLLETLRESYNLASLVTEEAKAAAKAEAEFARTLQAIRGLQSSLESAGLWETAQAMGRQAEHYALQLRDLAQLEPAMRKVREEQERAARAAEQQQRAIEAVLDDLQTKIALFGASPAEAVARQLAGMGADIATQLKGAELAETLDSMEKIAEESRKLKQLDADREAAAKRWIAEIATPLDKVRAQMDELNALVLTGKLSWAQWAEAVKLVEERAAELIDTFRGFAGLAPTAIYGSSEAASLESRFRAAMAPMARDRNPQLAEIRAEIRRLSDLVQRLGGQAIEAARVDSLVDKLSY